MFLSLFIVSFAVWTFALYKISFPTLMVIYHSTIFVKFYYSFCASLTFSH
jgi:hypothetical protein